MPNREVRLVVAAMLVALSYAPAASAQNEDALKRFFEGHRVTVKIDMPGTQEGVDVEADSSRALDYREYGYRLKTYGTAIDAGESAVVTLVKVKKDLIEFQLGGGGFGTFGDDTSASVYRPLLEKSNREKELEKLVRDEDDRRKRRQLQDELDKLRDRREAENRRIEADKLRAEEAKRERIANERLHGGSRFNVRYSDNVPGGIRPDELMAALAEYVDFSSLGGPGAERRAPLAAAPDTGSSPRKGMVRADVERLYGPAVQSSERREGSLTVTTVVFDRGDERVRAEFVEDVLVHYAITPK